MNPTQAPPGKLTCFTLSHPDPPTANHLVSTHWTHYVEGAGPLSQLAPRVSTSLHCLNIRVNQDKLPGQRISRIRKNPLSVPVAKPHVKLKAAITSKSSPAFKTKEKRESAQTTLFTISLRYYSGTLFSAF